MKIQCMSARVQTIVFSVLLLALFLFVVELRVRVVFYQTNSHYPLGLIQLFDDRYKLAAFLAPPYQPSRIVASGPLLLCRSCCGLLVHSGGSQDVICSKGGYPNESSRNRRGRIPHDEYCAGGLRWKAGNLDLRLLTHIRRSC